MSNPRTRRLLPSRQEQTIVTAAGVKIPEAASSPLFGLVAGHFTKQLGTLLIYWCANSPSPSPIPYTRLLLVFFTPAAAAIVCSSPPTTPSTHPPFPVCQLHACVRHGRQCRQGHRLNASRRKHSGEWFRSTDLWVMSPARYHCATPLVTDGLLRGALLKAWCILLLRSDNNVKVSHRLSI